MNSPLPWSLPKQFHNAKNFSPSDAEAVRLSLDSFDPSLPIESARMPPSSWYLSDAFMRAEMGGIFSRTWQVACRADQVARSGQYVATYTANGEPVLITRGSDGILRAFANVCRHHAARVAEGCGVAKEFVCPYHAWTYNQEGRLTKATRIKGMKDFSAGKVGLTPLGVEQWGPLVFVNHHPDESIPPPPRRPSPPHVDDQSSIHTPSGEAPISDKPWRRSVSEQLAPAAQAMDGLPPPTPGLPTWSNGDSNNFHFLQRRVYEINCNWKVYCDNYLDGGYHIPALHRGLLDELDMSTYSTTLHPSLSIQTCQSVSHRVGTAPVYAFLFPNLAINRYGDWLDTNLVLPVSPERCVVVFDWFHRHAPSEGEEPSKRQTELLQSLQASLTIQDEDVGISESVQCGLGSGSYDAGRYAPSVETGELHFHKLLHAALNEHVTV